MPNTASHQSSQGATPILASLHSAYALYRDSREKRPEARMQLTGLVSDLMSLDLSQHEIDMVADVLIALAKQAEVDLRKAMAERISALDNAPLRLVMQMANDEIAVAKPVLRNSTVLKDKDLADIIGCKGSNHWQAIAQRPFLSDVIINSLADTNDFPTGTALAENITITLTDHAVGVLAEMAQSSEVLAQPLLRRAEVPDDVASQLYRHVGQTLKKFILKNYEVDTKALMDTIDDVVLEFVDRSRTIDTGTLSSSIGLPSHDEFTPTQAMLKAARQFKQKGLLTVQLMLNTLRRGQMSSFIAQFASYCNLELNNIMELLHQRRARALAVMCKASNIGRQDFISFYLLTNTVRNSGQLIDFKEMSSAVTMYDRTSSDAARQIVNQSLDKLLSDA